MFTPLIFTLSVIAIVYTSLVAFRQTDIKKLIAYSSVAHMGFVTMGIFSGNVQGEQGAIFQMLSHGVISGVSWPSTSASALAARRWQVQASRKCRAGRESAARRALHESVGRAIARTRVRGSSVSRQALRLLAHRVAPQLSAPRARTVAVRQCGRRAGSWLDRHQSVNASR